MTVLRLSLAAAFVVVCWAYAPIGIHIGLRAYDPSHLALLRFLIASAFLAVAASVRRVPLPEAGEWPLLFVLGLFAVALHHISLNYGQQGIGAGAASILAQSTPIFTALIARFFLGEAVGVLRWACIAGGVAGAAIVVIGNKGLDSFDYHGLLILAAAGSWSVYFCLQRRYAKRQAAFPVVCYTVWIGTAQLCFYLPGLGAEIAAAPWRVNCAVLLLGLFPSALAYLGWAYVLNHVEVSRASIVLYFVPLVAILMAWLVLGERPTGSVLLGGALVVASVLAMSFGSSAPTAPASPPGPGTPRPRSG